MLKYLLLLFVIPAAAQIGVSENKRFLSTADGKPFFWLGDTAWELFHRCTREEAESYLETRRQQGFNVIQAVALAEFNGLHGPNRYGDLPLLNDDPLKLAITPGNDPSDSSQYDYWDHVDFIVSKAADKGLYIGLLPTWGDKVAQLWGDGPIIFNEVNAEIYAKTLAKRFAKQWNVIWVLGGDRPAVYQTKNGEKDDRPVWRAMAKGIEEILGADAFITYHPWGGVNSTSQFIQQESWLDMNAFQSGHGSRDAEAWNYVARDLALQPLRPTIDMEPCYEDHPVNPWDGKWTRQRGYFTAYDVRARIYRSVFAGGCGVTYGHHQVWQFLDTILYDPVNIGDTIIGWKKAMHAEAAGQLQFLKRLLLSRPYYDRIGDETLVRNPGSSYEDLIYATRGKDRSYAFIYLPRNNPVIVDLGAFSGKSKNIWWFDPRTGKSIKGETVIDRTLHTFHPPESGRDWVLVIDDAAKKFPEPGTGPVRP